MSLSRYAQDASSYITPQSVRTFYQAARDGRSAYREYSRRQDNPRRRRTPLPQKEMPKSVRQRSTQTTTTSHTRHGTMKDSKSSGFFKKPRGRKNMARGKGSILVLEKGGVLQSPRVVTVGHVVLPRAQLLKVMGMALVKAMMARIGIIFEGWNNNCVANGLQVGDLFEITLRTLGNDVSSNGVFNVATLAVGTTFEDLANGAAVVFGGNASDQTEYERVVYKKVSGADTFFIDFATANFHIDCKSTLKMQNQSTPLPVAPETEADVAQIDEVDSVPVYGKQYEGSGNGTTKLKRNTLVGIDVSLLGNETSGLISRVDGDAQLIDEPGDGFEYANVSKVGKAHLDPGQLKTSVLNWSTKMNFNRFRDFACNVAISGLTKYKSRIGKFRFFQLEKMLEINQTTPRSISIAYEHNLVMRAQLTYKNNTSTQKLYVPIA